jgi:hypothetical protein
MKAFQPDDVEIIRTAIRNRLADVRTSIPAIIKSYDAAKQTCTCELSTRLPAADGTPDQLPPLEDVPVTWQRGGGYFCSMPLAAGDAGLLVFCEADFSAWRESGAISDPPQERRHGLYAYFVPGGCASGKELADAAHDKLVIGKDGGPSIKIDASGFQIGGPSAQYVAIEALVAAQLNVLKSAIAGAVVVPTDGGASFKTTLLAALSAWPASMAATKTKAE